MKSHCFIAGLRCFGVALTSSCIGTTFNQKYIMQQHEINKSIIRDFYRRAVGQGDIAFAEEIISDEYIQHSVQVKPGKAGLLEALQYMKQMPKPATITAPFMRLIAEGEYVVTNMSFSWGDKQKIVVDLFRFENGKVAEHWDAIQDQPETSRNGNAMMDGPLPEGDSQLTATNKAIVGEFYQQVFVNRQIELLTTFIISDLIQHIPEIANGLAGLKEYVVQKPSNFSVNMIHRIIGEGDFVVVQAEGKLAQKQAVFYDIFRLNKGKIVEQWSVKQTGM